MAKVLFVCKPLAPPWNDSTKNLARDVSSHLREHEATFVRRRAGTKGFAPSLAENLDVLRFLLGDSDADLWHFFFAPNLKTSTAACVAQRLRRARTLHTVCSLPRERADTSKLVFADRTVVLSRFALNRFVREGVDAARLVLIPPCVPALDAPTASERASFRSHHGLPASAAVWIYPGDLEHGGGAELVLEAFAAWARKDSLLLMASRHKTRRALTQRDRLIERTKRRGIASQVRWIGETSHIHALLAASDFVLLPNRSPHAKMDYPLVALEAMSMKKPVFVAEHTPAAELAELGGAIAVKPNADALAHAVDEFISNREVGDSLCVKAREVVLDRFSPRRIAAAYERLYEELHAA